MHTIISILFNIIVVGIGLFAIQKYISSKFEIKINDLNNKNEIALAEINSKLSIKSNNIIQMSEGQKCVLSMFLKWQTNYYSDETLLELPYCMSNNKKARYNSFIEKETVQLGEGRTGGKLTLSSVINLRIIHAAYEESEELGNKLLNATNPVVAFNVMMIETCASEKSMKVISYYMQNHYTNHIEKLGTKAGILYLNSLMYKCLIFDYKGITIEDNTFLTYYLKDFKDIQEEMDDAFSKLKKEIGIE